MKAIVCLEPFHLDLVNRPEPQVGAGDVLVKVKRVGLCGTDYHIYGGRHPFLAYPRVIGHELAGEVAQAPAWSSFKPGQTVAINPYLSCGRCIACSADKPNACVEIRVLGVHTDGGMCEFVAVPESAVIDATGLSFDQAAMIEFLAVGAHAVARARLAPHKRALVVGAGPIGMAVALFARLEGLDVTLVDTHPSRVAYARSGFGFQNALVAGDDLEHALAERTAGAMMDVVFDATGASSAMNKSLYYLAHGGTLVFVGVTPSEIQFPGPEFHKRETTLLSSRNAHARDFARVVSAMKAGEISTDALKTHAFPVEEVVTMLPHLIAGSEHPLLKAIAHF